MGTTSRYDLAVDWDVKHQLEKANIRTTSVYDVALNTPLQSVLALSNTSQAFAVIIVTAYQDDKSFLRCF